MIEFLLRNLRYACPVSMLVFFQKKGAFRTPFLIDKGKKYFTKNQIYATW